MIYLDNAATSYPKPAAVHRAVKQAMEIPLGNPGRSVHAAAMTAAQILLDTRTVLGELFGASEERVIFTHNTSHALNLAIFGLCRGFSPEKNVVVTDPFQHNSVLRPLYALEREGRIRLRFCPPGKPEAALDSAVALGVFSAQSNTTGEVFPLASMARSLHRAGALFLCDGAQGAGHLPLSLEQGMDLLCIPGHKGLLGITGAGALLLSPRCPPLVPLFFGGTGSAGQSPQMPDLLPDRLEVGTPALISLAAMGAGARYVQELGIGAIGEHLRSLTALFQREIAADPSLILYSPADAAGIVLLNRRGQSPHLLAEALDRRGICVRSGFHCAPLAHEYLATGEDGALRFSFGPFNTPAQAIAAARALMEL